MPESVAGGTAENPQQLTEKTKAKNEVVAMMRNLDLEKGPITVVPRKKPGRNGQKIAIDTNVYQVRLTDKSIYRYDVTMSGQSKRGKTVDLTKRSESTAIVADRINICRAAFRCVMNDYPDVLGTDVQAIYYDLQSILYTCKKLNMTTEKISLTVESNERIDRAMPANLQSITMDIKAVKDEAKTIQLDDLSKVINAETLERDRSVLNFIEMAVNQQPMFNENDFLSLRGSTVYFYDGKKFGIPELNLDTGQTKYLASGVQKSAMLMEGFKKQGVVDEQRHVGFLLEAKHSPFHAPMPLLRAISQHENTSGLCDALVNGTCNDGQLASATRSFKRIAFNIQYNSGRKGNVRIELKNFVHDTAVSHRIDDLNMTVAQYFDQHHGGLRYPHAHLVETKQGTKKNYYPPEVLFLADNQVVTVEQMDARSKAAMIKECAVRPNKMQQENLAAAEAIGLRTSEYTVNAGIAFSKVPLATNAHVLPPPRVRYGNRVVATPRTEAAWMAGNFLRPAITDGYAVYLLHRDQGRPDLSVKEIDAFTCEIDKICEQRRDLSIGKCRDKGIYKEYEVVKCIEYCAQNDIKLCLFVSPDYVKSAHADMKMCEHKFNVVTQDLKLSTLRKIMNRGSATLQNYIAKTNMKLGGLNYEVEYTDSLIQKELEETLFIGINSNQPGSKTAVDRMKSISSEKPGVLGFAANTNENSNEFVGDFYYTVAYRLEFYSQLRGITKRCVAQYKQNRKNPPNKIVFFYTGLTEGQFENAYKYAIPLMKQGVRESNGDKDIPLTVLAVQKMNNIRLFPKVYPQNALRDHEYNVPCGTTVDETVVHPVIPEFYQMAHSALKGTGRVPRYMFVLDENEYSMDTVEGFTHALTYNHQIVGRTTALPTPVYVAENYAKRGRDVYNAAFKENEGLIEAFPKNIDGSVNFVELSQRLNYEKTQLEKWRVNA